MKKKYVLGWQPDLPDARDHYFKVSRLRAVPSRVDLREKCSSVEDQQDIGSCVAQSLVANMEFLDRVQGHATISGWTDLSRLFVYYIARGLTNKGEDSGAYIRDGIKALASYGACDEKLWPYIPAKFSTKPTLRCFRDALKRRITEYRRVDGLFGIKQVLASGFPCVFGFTVYDSFFNVGKDGVMPMPDFTKEQSQGGHAVLCVGYDDAMQALIVRNSWGASWGKDGYFYMPYKFAENGDLTADWWTITREMENVQGFDPSPDPDVKWYVPVVDIVVAAWGWIFAKKPSKKGETK
jgi:C1A family cysteine protease